MDIRIIEDRIRKYSPESKREELNVIKEIAQEITLQALSRSNFFKHGAFQGGTCLRIVYGLPRFSEDLDFVLFEPNPNFVWGPYFNELKLEFESFGFSIEAADRSQAGNAVKKAFLKENSFGQVLDLVYARNRSDEQTIKIKLEVDTNPPAGSTFETKLAKFPFPFSIVTQTLPSLFAGKVHALLAREYIKGRDWFDLTWYVTRNALINYSLLNEALYQQGPWSQQDLNVDKDWVLESLRGKIRSIDWNLARKDVEGFLKPRELMSTELWSSDFFEEFIQTMDQYLLDSRC